MWRRVLEMNGIAETDNTSANDSNGWLTGELASLVGVQQDRVREV